MTIAEVADVVHLFEVVVLAILEGRWIPETDRTHINVIVARQAVRTTARVKAFSRLFRNVDINEQPAAYPAADRAAAGAEIQVLKMLFIPNEAATDRDSFSA